MTDAPALVWLDTPRVPTAAETAVLHRMAALHAEHAGLAEQLAAARVAATCSCGCPSLTLAVPDETPDVALDPGATGVRHGFDASLHAHPDGDLAVDVIVHVLAGRVVELEVWAGSLGGGPRVPLPDRAALRCAAADAQAVAAASKASRAA